MGDVTPLLKGIDDRFVVFGSGEEIAAEFDAASLPACPRMEARLLLLCQRICERYGLVGCVALHRGADAVSRHEHIPYPAERKVSRRCQSLDYQLNWNDRFDSGEPVRSYRFNYQRCRRRRGRSVRRPSEAPGTQP
jgi:hypothetical protein